MMAEGKLFSYITKYKPGFDTQESKFTGYEMISFELSEAYMNTSTATNGQWSISSTCENPEKAMQVLNMLFSNSDIMNLLRWGIEGEHYVMLDNGFIDYPEGVDAENLSYNMTANWYLPNQYISYIWNGDISTLGKDVKKFNSEAIRSPALGFRFNSGPVAPEYEAVSEIYSTYVECFTRGELELETAYPEFLDLLDKAGLDTIIAEKQRQLDEWFAENG